MNTLENISLFSDLSAEESVDINGGAIAAHIDFTGLLLAAGVGATFPFLGFNAAVTNEAVANIIKLSTLVVTTP